MSAHGELGAQLRPDAAEDATDRRCDDAACECLLLRGCGVACRRVFFSAFCFCFCCWNESMR